MSERVSKGQEKSEWKPRLLKIGIVSTIVGVIASSALFLGIGVSAWEGSALLGRKDKK